MVNDQIMLIYKLYKEAYTLKQTSILVNVSIFKVRRTIKKINSGYNNSKFIILKNLKESFN